jgi:hypothetical protein
VPAFICLEVTSPSTAVFTIMLIIIVCMAVKTNVGEETRRQSIDSIHGEKKISTNVVVGRASQNGVCIERPIRDGVECLNESNF